MAVGGCVHVQVEIILKLINLNCLHQIASFKPTLKYECLIILIFKLIKLRQFWIKPIELYPISCAIIFHTFFGAITHNPLGFVNVISLPFLWTVIRIINQNFFPYQRAQMVPQVFNQDVFVFKTQIFGKRLCFWALLVVVRSVSQEWLVYACFWQWFVDESYCIILDLTRADRVDVFGLWLSLRWLREIGLTIGVLPNWTLWFLMLLCFILYRRLWFSFLELILMAVLRHSQAFVVLVELIVEIVGILILQALSFSIFHFYLI